MSMVLDVVEVAKKYVHADNRLILLDYEGTLVDEQQSSGTSPSADVISILHDLGGEERNKVILLVDSPLADAARWLKGLPVTPVQKSNFLLLISGLHEGSAATLAALWGDIPFDFVLAIGDGLADEKKLVSLSPTTFLIQVGTQHSPPAGYHLADQTYVIPFLRGTTLFSVVKEVN